MEGLKKSKRVTWAPGANLSQVKFFLSEDCPSKVRVETQHRHQSKTSNSNVRSFNKFPAWYVNPLRGRHYVNSSRGNLSCIPQIQWKCPPEFALDINWRVAAGEESEEAKVQKDREIKVLEAVYPRVSAIPPSPSISLDDEDRCYDDTQTPLIPIIPIEEVAAAAILPSDAMAPLVLPMNSQPPALSRGPSASATPCISQCTMNLQPPSLALGPFTSADSNLPQRTISQPASVAFGPSISATSKLPQHTVNSQPPSLAFGPSTSATSKLPHCTMNSQRPSTPATSKLPQHTMNSQPASLALGPSKSATSRLPECTMNSQPPFIYQHPSTSATSKLPQHTMNSQPPSLTLGPSTSASSRSPQCTMNSQPPSLSLGPSISATPCIPQPTMNAQPAILSQLPSTFATPVLPQCTMNSQPPSLSQGPSTSRTLHISHCNPPESQNFPACEKSSTSNGLDSNVVDAVTAAAAAIAENKEQGSLIDTGLLVKFLSEPKMIEKLMKEHGLAPNTEIKTTFGPNPVPSSISLPSTMPDLSIKKATNEHNEPANYRTEAIARPVIVSRSLPLPSTKTEVVSNNSVTEHGTEATITAVSGRRVLPFPSTEPEVLRGKVIEDHVGPNPGIDTKAISRPVIAPPFPSKNTEVVPSKLIAKHGETHAGTSPVYGSKPAVIKVPVPQAKDDVSLIKSFNSSIQQGRPACNVTQQAISKTVISSQFHPLPSGKAEVVGNKLIEEHGGSYVGPAVYGPNPMAKSVPLLSSKPEVSLGKTLVNEYRAPAHAGIARIIGIQPVTPLVPVPSAVRPNVEMIKKLINEYGAPDNAGQKTLPAGRQNVEMMKKLINEYGSSDNAGQQSLPLGRQNVEMIKKLINEYGAPDNAGQKSLLASEPTLLPLPRTTSGMVVSPGANLYTMPNTLQPNLHKKSISPSSVHPSPFPSLTTPAPPLKDINYLKSLVKQHGEKHDILDHNLSQYGIPHNHLPGPELVQDLKPTEHNARHQKPCMFFHSSRGCRNGSNCSYLHDTSKLSRPGSMLETPGTKRVKLVGELVGRT